MLDHTIQYSTLTVLEHEINTIQYIDNLSPRHLLVLWVLKWLDTIVHFSVVQLFYVRPKLQIISYNTMSDEHCVEYSTYNTSNISTVLCVFVIWIRGKVVPQDYPDKHDISLASSTQQIYILETLNVKCKCWIWYIVTILTKIH